MLSADCERWTSGAAAVSEPASTTATKARSQSIWKSDRRIAMLSKIEW